jgi:hypothetical protein
VVVIGPGAGVPARDVSAPEVRALYEEVAGRGLGRREALRETARRLGISRREVFASLLGDEREDRGS